MEGINVENNGFLNVDIIWRKRGLKELGKALRYHCQGFQKILSKEIESINNRILKINPHSGAGWAYNAHQLDQERGFTIAT